MSSVWDEMARQWQRALEQHADIARSWGAEHAQLAEAFAGRTFDPVSLSLMGSEVGDAVRRMTEGPRFSDLGVMERRMASLTERYLEVQQATRAYEAVVARAWGETNRRFAEELSRRLTSEDALREPKQALRLWLETADEVLTAAHRSDEFLQAQSTLLRTGMEFLLAERAVVEDLAEPAGFPTRSEIDEVHLSVHTLKRRVRALEKTSGTSPEGDRP